MKFQYILTLCSLCQAAYVSRMTPVNRLRAPTAFRPGVALQRPWNHPRLVQAASHRAPYVLYRNPPHRYAPKHHIPPRNINSPWKTTARLPQLSPSTPEYEFLRAASSPPAIHTDGGAIHTIPAPNLSLSEKPIVVLDTSENIANNNAASVEPKPIYDVTEKYPEAVYQMAKIEAPIGFSRTSLTNPELQNLIRNGATLQLAPEYSVSTVNVPQAQIIPQQYAIQGYQGLPTHQELLNSGAEGIVIPPHALYQPDPMFLQKLQNQLLQKFPAVEFIPYAADVSSMQVPNPPTHQQHQLFLLENEELRQEPSPSSFVPSVHQKNVVQRETQESSLVTLIPQAFVVNNVTEKTEVKTPSEPQNITLELIAAESQPITTTIKYVVETDTEKQNTTPIFYAQIGQNVGNALANGLYSAINDVRAAAALDSATPQEATTKVVTENASTTINPDLKAYFVQSSDSNENQTATELKPLLGAPFVKPGESVNVAYTLLRTDDKDLKMTQEGTVYAGQIVEATISEDQDFNKEKATFMSRRAPIRLFAVSEKNDIDTAASNAAAPKFAVVKAKIPPKSKLIFDDKTGEPVLRIYASYLDSPAQREMIASKLSSLKHIKEATVRKEIVDNWKAATVGTADKTQGFDGNQVTQFGLKLRARSDDYLPLFEEYDE